MFFYRVRVSAEDGHSGVRKISFRFMVNGTREEKAKKDFLIEPKVLLFSKHVLSLIIAYLLLS